MDIDAIFAADREHSPAARSLPWLESKAGVTVVIEPKPHWASDLRAFRQDAQEYCYYRDWVAHGPRAHFFAHVSLNGANLLRDVRAMIEQEIRERWQEACRRRTADHINHQIDVARQGRAKTPHGILRQRR